MGTTDGGFDLNGRVAVVTGAGKGLGATFAVALARAGADVVLTSRTTSDLEAVAARVDGLGRRSLIVAGDVSQEADVRRLAAETLDCFGRVDVLVNNAGIEGIGAATDIDVAAWDRVMAVNVRGPMLCCKHFGPAMIERGAGKVINVASVLASRPQRTMAPYAASKAALVQYTKVVALEWAAHNIQVNALCPGYVSTPMNREFLASTAGQKMLARLPTKRAGEPSEVEGAIVYLASDAANFVTGTELYVDGGHSLR